jgi:hypothetical protein
MGNWRYSPDLDAGRRARLEASVPFGVIAQRIADEMRILCTHIDPCDEAAGFSRIVSCVRVGENLFDSFFNSETGYRGCYFVSSTEGLSANSLLLGLVASPLAQFRTHEEMNAQRAEQSLRASSAKCWLAEVGKGFCEACAGEWTTPQDDIAEILNSRWEYGDTAASRSGRKAPLLRQLRILGAFVNAVGEQYVTTRKRNRAEEIHEHGWS